MALAAAVANQDKCAAMSALLQTGVPLPPDSQTECEAWESTLPPTAWPENYKAIRRIKFESVEQMLAIMKPQSVEGSPLIIEGTNVMDTKKWADLSYLESQLGDKAVLVKRSDTNKFRYFDLKKNTGKYDFKQPVGETQQQVGDFLQEANQLLKEGSSKRMYLQETLSGHSEMASEFATWGWELLIRTSQACGWGLPDSNELFVGMRGVETPLHFDERENLFFQVRGEKEVVVFPFVDYTKLYPFPTSHPCDRQSMVGSPATPNLEAFPRFKDSIGQYAVLKAGDMLYLPYGWWHWLRNIDHLAISVSFWSTTPTNDLKSGIPDVFSDHMLTRVRRNLESMIATQYGPENHNASMIRLKEAVQTKNEQDPVLKQVRTLLGAVRMDPQKQDTFLLDQIEGRFGVDWNAHAVG
mmetsp:Transcript_43461/g.93110  ORF Transcript_43461/g.93110 Transcript_43461/m.93110 type:complete len:411 (-) Transcript_43461:11-1243(-)